MQHYAEHYLLRKIAELQAELALEKLKRRGIPDPDKEAVHRYWYEPKFHAVSKFLERVGFTPGQAISITDEIDRVYTDRPRDFKPPAQIHQDLTSTALLSDALLNSWDD